jgi:hypothetical protein
MPLHIRVTATRSPGGPARPSEEPCPDRALGALHRTPPRPNFGSPCQPPGTQLVPVIDTEVLSPISILLSTIQVIANIARISYLHRKKLQLSSALTSPHRGSRPGCGEARRISEAEAASRAEPLPGFSGMLPVRSVLSISHDANLFKHVAKRLLKTEYYSGVVTSVDSASKEPRCDTQARSCLNRADAT